MAEVMSQEQSWSEALCPQALSFILRTRTGIQEFADLFNHSFTKFPKEYLYF